MSMGFLSSHIHVQCLRRSPPEALKSIVGVFTNLNALGMLTSRLHLQFSKVIANHIEGEVWKITCILILRRNNTNEVEKDT
jgi:hypothetical protein